MFNFAGVNFIMDPLGEAEEFIRRRVPAHRYFPWRRPSTPGFGTAGVSYPRAMYAEPPFELNALHWPLGAFGLSRWAFVHGLVGSDQVEMLRPLTCDRGLYKAATLKVGSQETGGEKVQVPMYLLPPTPLSGMRGVAGVAQSLYLVTLVDFRYFLQFVDTGDLTAFMDGGPTWRALYQYLAGRVADEAGEDKVLLTWDEIPAEYLSPSVQMFNLPYEPINLVLDAVAYNVGQRIVAAYTIEPGGQVGYHGMNYATALQRYEQDRDAHPGRRVLAGGLRGARPL